MNANCDKETSFVRQHHVILYERFPKPKADTGDVLCYYLLPDRFPPAAGGVSQVPNSQIQPIGHRRPTAKVKGPVSVSLGSLRAVLLLPPAHAANAAAPTDIKFSRILHKDTP